MNFVKSFFKTTISTPVRFILSTLVWTVICTLLLIGLSLQHVADNASSNAKKSIGSTVTLIAKQKKVTEAASTNTNETISLFKSSDVKISDVKKLAELKHLNTYNFVVSTPAIANFSNTLQDITVTGVLSNAATEDFSNGTHTIVNGTGISSDTASNGVVLEKNMAASHHLKVGETFELLSDHGDTLKKVTITGLYTSKNENSSKIYAPYQLAKALKGQGSKATIDLATFTLDGPQYIADFKEKAEQMKTIDWDKNTLIGDDSAYQQLTGPISDMHALGEKLVYRTIIIGFILILLLQLAFVYYRKQLNQTDTLTHLTGFKRLLIDLLLPIIIALLIASMSATSLTKIIAEHSASPVISKVEQVSPIAFLFDHTQQASIQSVSAAQPAFNLTSFPSLELLFKTFGLALFISIVAVSIIIFILYRQKKTIN